MSQATTVFNDTFTGTGELTTHTPDTDTPGGGWLTSFGTSRAILSSNQLLIRYSNLYSAWCDLGSNDARVTVNWNAGGGTNSPLLLVARTDPTGYTALADLSTANGYGLVANYTDQELQLYLYQDGGKTLLDSASATLASATTYDLEIEVLDGVIVGRIDDVDTVTYTAATPLAGTFASLSIYANSNWAGLFDSFVGATLTQDPVTPDETLVVTDTFTAGVDYDYATSGGRAPDTLNTPGNSLTTSTSGSSRVVLIAANDNVRIRYDTPISNLMYNIGTSRHIVQAVATVADAACDPMLLAGGSAQALLTAYTGYAFYADTSADILYLSKYAAGTETVKTSTAYTINTATAYTLKLSYDSSTGVVQCYVDGVEITALSWTDLTPLTGTYIGFGSHATSGGDPVRWDNLNAWTITGSGTPDTSDTLRISSLKVLHATVCDFPTRGDIALSGWAPTDLLSTPTPVNPDNSGSVIRGPAIVLNRSLARGKGKRFEL